MKKAIGLVRMGARRSLSTSCLKGSVNKTPAGGSPSKSGGLASATYATAAQTKIDPDFSGCEALELSMEEREHYCSVSLSEPLKNLHEAQYSPEGPVGEGANDDPYHTELTTLSNGLRVASSPLVGEFATIGVCIDAGSRYEVAYPSGVSHFLEKLAFNSNTKYSDQQSLYADLEQFGGICDCQSTKDTFIYGASCHGSCVDPVLEIIANASLRPSLTEEEVEKTREIVAFELEDMNRDPNPERLLTDWIHKAAYNDNSLGLPKYCPEENISKITRPMLFSFMKTYFDPSRMVISGFWPSDFAEDIFWMLGLVVLRKDVRPAHGYSKQPEDFAKRPSVISVGVNHEELVESAQKYLVDESPIWTANLPVALERVPEVDESRAQYTGGIVKVEKDLSNVALGPTPMPELAHFMLALESCSYKDEDFVPFCVLNSLMGGGGSFSAGGPGKGMYTRLYTNVLNRFHWMYNATSYHHTYADSGIFCIHASANPKSLSDLVMIIVREFIEMTGDIQEEELSRAKKQLEAMLLMNLEQRPVMFEDIGRQIMGHGHRKSPRKYIDDIRHVSKKDIHRAVDRMLHSKSSVVGYGTLKKLPDYEKIDKALAHRDSSHLKPSRYFAF